MVHRHERARGGLRPGRAQDPGRARRRRLRHQRPEDLDQLRRGGRLLLPDLPHLDRGPAARRHQRDRRAHGHAGHRGPTHPGHDDQPALLRGLLHRRPGAGEQPRRRRGRGVQADHAPARARAGRHRPPGLQPGPVPGRRSSGPTGPIRSCARRSPAWRPATASAACWYCGRCSARRRTGFSAATKCFCTEHEWQVAEFVARVLGPGGHAVGPARAGPDLRAGLHDHGRHLERDAQHPR